MISALSLLKCTWASKMKHATMGIKSDLFPSISKWDVLGLKYWDVLGYIEIYWDILGYIGIYWDILGYMQTIPSGKLTVCY